MAITKLQPFNLDTTANYTFANITATNANLGNAATANYFIGSGNNLSNIQGSNVTGAVTYATTANAVAGANVSGQVANSLIAGTVYTNAQPNITSIGSLTGLTVSNATGVVNFITTANVSLGAVGNLKITGGTSSQYLQTDGTGNLSWSTVTTGSTSSISNGNSNVNIPTANGNVNISAVGNANVVVVTGTGLNVTGDANISGNLTAGNINAGSGTGGSISGANSVTANFFIGSGNNLSNIQGANVTGAVSYATTANSVAGANVSGAVAYATTANSVAGANVSGAVSYATTANSVAGANVSGQVSNSLIAGTVYTNAQPNITSTGTLTSLTVSGNANTGNLGTTNLIATGTGSFGANVNMNTYWINNVGYPSLSTDAATKSYVDTMISSGISYHQPVAVATTTTLATATGGTTSYNSPNGAANGIGAYISTTGTFLNIDTANVQTIGTRILVKDESNAAWNGVYTYANTTAIVRATDADEYGADSTTQLSINDFFFTSGGSVNKGTSFVVSAPSGTITFGTSNITFSVFSTSQVYDAGTGLTLSGTTFSITNTTVTSGSYGNGDTVATFTVNSQGQLTAASNTAITANAANLTGTTLNSSIVTSSLTSVGTLGSLTVTGNISSGNANLGNNVSANYFTGNGIYLTGITTAGISNGNSNVNIPAANGNVNISAVGNANVLVVTGTGANISGTANVTGNLTAGNIIAGSGSGGNITNANVISANTFIASANITAGNANLGNAATANYFIGNFYGTANLATYATTANSVAGANVSGQVSNALVAGTVYTNAQPNITSVGSLTGLTVSNATGVVNFITTANVSLGAVGNLKITGGTSSQYLQTDGAGNLSWSTVISGSSSNISNGNSNVNIPAANGNVNISAVGNANVLVITGTGANITGTANITGNLTAGNIIAGSGSGGNISNANVISANTFIASANITAGNANLGNLTISNYFRGVFDNTSSSQPNITSVGSLTGLTVSNATGVVNFITTSNVSLGAVGNVKITGGTSGYVLQTDGAGNLSWVAQSGGGGGASISNGNSNVNIPAANGNVNITAVGNTTAVITGTGANIFGTLNVTGNATVGNLITSGSGGNITSVNVISANTFIASGNMTAGNVIGIIAAGSNTITTTGNANVGNLGTAQVLASANITTPQFISNVATGTAPLVVTSTTQVANLSVATAGTATTAGTVTTAAQPNITSVGSLTGLTVSNATGVVNFITTSNVSLGAVGNLKITGGTSSQYLQTDGAGNLSWATVSAGSGSNISNGNSNVSIPAANGNVNITAVGNTTAVITGTGVNVFGTLNTGAGVITGNGSGLSAIAGGNITGQVGNALVAGTVYTNAQPNITSVGSLTGLTVSNATGVVDFTTTANVTLGAVANLHISGGTSGYVLQTDGAGTLSWVAQSGGGGGGGASISNGNSNVNIATANGNITMTAVGNTIVTVTGTGANVTGNLGVIGANVSLGNVSNLHVTGGSNGYVLKTDGTGNLSWGAQGTTTTSIQQFTATAAQTTFTVSGGYSVGSVLVFVNGVQMNDGDYTATNGTTVVLTEPRVAGDIVRIVSSIAAVNMVVSQLQNFSVAMSIALGI